MIIRLGRRTLPWLVTMALAASACGGSGHVSATTPDPPFTPTTPGGAPADPARLRAMVLQASDLPAGWNGAPAPPGPAGPYDNSALARCVGVRDTTLDAVASVKSDVFSLGDAKIASSAASYRSPADVPVDVSAWRSPKFSACLEQVLGSQLAGALPAGAAIKGFVMKVTPGSVGPPNLVATGAGAFTVTAAGQRLSFFINLAFVAGPLLEAQLSFVNAGAEVPATLRTALVGKIAARAATG